MALRRVSGRSANRKGRRWWNRWMQDTSASPSCGAGREKRLPAGGDLGGRSRSAVSAWPFDVWFRSYVVPVRYPDATVLAPDVPQVDGVGTSSGGRFWSAFQVDPLNPNSVNRASDRWNRYLLLALNPARYCTPQRRAQPLRYGTLTFAISCAAIFCIIPGK